MAPNLQSTNGKPQLLVTGGVRDASQRSQWSGSIGDDRASSGYLAHAKPLIAWFLLLFRVFCAAVLESSGYCFKKKEATFVVVHNGRVL